MTSFGRYQLDRLLGQGGMAEVFLARQVGAVGIGRNVVIKRVLPDLNDNPDFLKLFIGEAQLSMQLSHGNVVQVFDFGEVDGQYFLAMEWVDGLSLRQLIDFARAQGADAIPAPIAVVIVIELCKALQYAHTRANEDGESLRVVHRDVSPENVLLSWQGQVKLADFGIARAAMVGRERTNPNVFRGRFDFAAPEQARGQAVDGRSDLYSVGVLLTEMVLGENPILARAYEIASGQERAPRFPPSAVDAGLAAIVDKCTEPLAVNRYQSAQELQRALQAWLTKNAQMVAVTALPNFLAWVQPEEVKRRGLPVEVSRDFTDWLELWRLKPWTQPPNEQLLVSGKKAAVTAKLPPRKGSRALVGLIVASVVMAGALVVLVVPGEEPAPPKASPVKIVRATPPPPPQPPPVVEPPKPEEPPRVHSGPGTVTINSRDHGRIIDENSGVRFVASQGTLVLSADYAAVRRNPKSGVPLLGEVSLFATFFAPDGEQLESRFIGKRPSRAPTGAASAQVWLIEDEALNQIAPLDIKVLANNESRSKIVRDLQLLLKSDARYSFTELSPNESYQLSVSGPSVIAASLPLRNAEVPFQPAPHFEGRKQLFPPTQTLISPGEAVLFTGAREISLAIITSKEGDGLQATVTLAIKPQRDPPDIAVIKRILGSLAAPAGETRVNSLLLYRATDEIEKTCVQRFAESAACYLAAGDLWARLGKYNKASYYYSMYREKAPSTDPDRPRVSRWLAHPPAESGTLP